jgi:16S rRNA (cytosine967-C5)-methyltransferase
LKKTENDLSDSIIAELTKQGVNVRQDSHFSEIYLTDLKNKKKIVVSRFFNEKKIVIQDKASYTVANLLDPRADELIFDMCAAPGIKTSIISQLSQNKSRLIANDFNTARASALNQFLISLNIENVPVLNSDSIAFPLRFNNYFDKILLDAPCTGSGTFSTNPELKWRQNEGFLHQNLTLQEKLLKKAIMLLKPSGILVYSTCSLYPEEGEHQILKVLHQLEPMKLPTWLSPSYKIDQQHIPGTGRLYPATHKTKGFFMAKFKKK